MRLGHCAQDVSSGHGALGPRNLSSPAPSACCTCTLVHVTSRGLQSSLGSLHPAWSCSRPPEAMLTRFVSTQAPLKLSFADVSSIPLPAGVERPPRE